MVVVAKQQREDATGSCLICYENFFSRSRRKEQEEEPRCPSAQQGSESVSSDVVRDNRGDTRKDRIELECQHAFCRECLTEYCKRNIGIKRIPIPCPTVGNKNEDCQQTLSDQLVQDIFRTSNADNNEKDKVEDSNATTLIKFRRFQRLLVDPTLLPCPNCDELVTSPSTHPEHRDNDAKGSKGSSGLDNNNTNFQRSCHSCQYTFCSVHGDAHPTTNCALYCASISKLQARQIRQSVATLNVFTKPCCHCTARIYKAVGCDHVVCPACHKDMCYKCGTDAFLTGKVIRTCANCQQGFVDHRYNREYRIRQCILLPFILPGMLLWVALMSVVAVVSLGFCCCFGCGTHVDGGDEDGRALAPAKGFHLGCSIVCLPLLQALRDFGLSCVSLDAVDEFFGDGSKLTEIPTMEIGQDGDDSVRGGSVEEV